MDQELLYKVKILAEAARYDVSCSSSGVSRRSREGELGHTASWGICHSFTADGRCISLWKTLLSNQCRYDCAYCVNRSSNDIARASFTAQEVVDITIEFYRRNYIEGLFLSSGILNNPDYTMERMIAILKELRRIYKFNGYIHLKAIPGAADELIREAGLYADRMSVNIEIPCEKSLKLLAPEKNHQSVYRPLHLIRDQIEENREDRRRRLPVPRFVPAGQSTQMIVGATDENDRDILTLAASLYQGPQLRRVYYSGFVPVNQYDQRLPKMKAVPLLRENRLYQADWLMRFYEFSAQEILSPGVPHLDLEIDPKLAWALRHPEFFPLNVNRADYHDLLRVPGLGVQSAKLILLARRTQRLRPEHLAKIGVFMKRAGYFLAFDQTPVRGINELGPAKLRGLLTGRNTKTDPRQGRLAFMDEP